MQVNRCSPASQFPITIAVDDAKLRRLVGSLVIRLHATLLQEPTTRRELVVLRAACIDFLDAKDLNALAGPAR